MRRQDFGEAETLRGLRPGEAGAVGLAQHGRVVHPLERVDDRQHGQGGGKVVQGTEHPVDQGGRHQRPGGVVHEHPLRRQLDETLQPGPHGGLPGLTADHGWQQLETFARLAVELRVGGTDDHADRIDAGMVCKRQD